MTNVEYKKIAQKVLEEVDNMQFENEDKITNISELFFLKIREAIIRSKNKKMSTYSEFKLIAKSLRDDKDDRDSDNYLFINEITDSYDFDPFYRISNFRKYQLLIEDFPNIEKVLLQLGIDTPKEFVEKVKSIDEISSEDDWKIVNMLVDFFEENGDKQKSYFTAFSTYYFLKKQCLILLDYIDKDKFLFASKLAKYIGNHYFDLYKERMIIYGDILTNLPDYFANHYAAITRIFKKEYSYMFNKFKFRNWRDCFEKYELYGQDDYESSAFTLDGIFILYFILYHVPIFVYLGFWLLDSEAIPLNLKLSLRESFKKKDYAPLIQYEYNWYLSKSDKRENLFDGIFYSGNLGNIDTLGITDYDLSKWEHLERLVEESNTIHELPQTQTSCSLYQKCNDIFFLIDSELYPFYVLFEQNSLSEKGHIFRKIYLSPLISYAATINDDYSLYGFAYLIFKSQFLNWKGLKFDERFVAKIKSIFAINCQNKVRYPESKAQCKAWRILAQSQFIPMELLAKEEIELLNFKFREKRLK